MTENNVSDLTSPEVTRKWSFDWKSPGSGCRRPISQVLGAFELVQGCNSQEVAVTRREMTSRDHVTRSYREVMSFDRKSPGSGCTRPVSQGLGTFGLLQGCNSQEMAVTRQEMTSRDLTWREVTRR